ncbi:MAG TPA: DNA repair protein RecO [Parasegetibacter sp.]
MLHSTKGLVLRVVKYGETSVIVSIFTEKLGVQSYIINGIRSKSKSAQSKQNFFQPGAMLDLQVYHNEQKNIQRIKDFGWANVYEHLFFDVEKNAVVVFCVELLQKCLKQPEPHEELFYFLEDCFFQLDKGGTKIVANSSLFIALHLAEHLGIRIINNYSPKHHILDLREGQFTADYPDHPYFVNGKPASIASDMMRLTQPSDLMNISIDLQSRRELLKACETFYALHITDFGSMRTLPVLQELMK